MSPHFIESTYGSENQVINNTDKNIDNWIKIKSYSCYKLVRKYIEIN